MSIYPGIDQLSIPSDSPPERLRYVYIVNPASYFKVAIVGISSAISVRPVAESLLLSSLVAIESHQSQSLFIERSTITLFLTIAYRQSASRLVNHLLFLLSELQLLDVHLN